MPFDAGRDSRTQSTGLQGTLTSSVSIARIIYILIFLNILFDSRTAYELSGTPGYRAKAVPTRSACALQRGATPGPAGSPSAAPWPSPPSRRRTTSQVRLDSSWNTRRTKKTGCSDVFRMTIPTRFRAASTFAPRIANLSFGRSVSHAVPTAVAHRTTESAPVYASDEEPNGVRPQGMGHGDSQADCHAQAVQASGRPMGRPQHRALTTDHADCENEGYEVGWNSVLSSV